MPIELNFEDIKGLASKPGVIPGAGVKAISSLGEVNTGQDLMAGINNLLDKVNTTLANARDMIGVFRGIGPGIGGPGLGGPGPGPGPGSPPKAYQPPPSLGQQLHHGLNICYSAYGDITIAELLQTLIQQYGNTKLSAALKALQKS